MSLRGRPRPPRSLSGWSLRCAAGGEALRGSASRRVGGQGDGATAERAAGQWGHRPVPTGPLASSLVAPLLSARGLGGDGPPPPAVAGDATQRPPSTPALRSRSSWRFGVPPVPCHAGPLPALDLSLSSPTVKPAGKAEKCAGQRPSVLPASPEPPFPPLRVTLPPPAVAGARVSLRPRAPRLSEPEAPGTWSAHGGGRLSPVPPASCISCAPLPAWLRDRGAAYTSRPLEAARGALSEGQAGRTVGQGQ